MKNSIVFFLILIIITILGFYLQELVINSYLYNLQFVFTTFSIYSFHFTTTALLYLMLLVVNKLDSSKLGFAFMFGTILKMAACILFFLFFPNYKFKAGNIDIFVFFIPYFFYLLTETVFTIKLLYKKNN